MESVHGLEASETLFIVSSKTFTTLETMTNAHSARAWTLAGLGDDEKAIARHFVAVFTNAAGVASSESIPPTSSNSGIGLSGFIHRFGNRLIHDDRDRLRKISAQMLAGFHRDGRAFPHRAARRNLPALMRAAGPSGTPTFCGAKRLAVLPYEQYLKRFPAYLQQLTMESNGKTCNTRRAST